GAHRRLRRHLGRGRAREDRPGVGDRRPARGRARGIRHRVRARDARQEVATGRPGNARRPRDRRDPALTSMPAAVLLRAESLAKTYTTPALADVSLEVRGGEVHALVGENGAGKSTLARILVGLTKPDAGRMLREGHAYAPSGKAEAARRGVAIVLQELNLVESLTVAEQVLLGAWPSRLGFVDRRALREQAHAALGRLGLRGIDIGRPVRSLGVGQRQMLAMAAALARPCRVLILDEPTAALSEHEAERLFAQMERLKAEGAAILYVSHRLEEVRRLADRVTVLRDGRVVAARERGETTSAELVQLMVGRGSGSR